MLPRIDGPEVALSNGVRSLNIEDPPFSSGDPGPSSTLHRNALNHHTSKAPQPSASEDVWYAPYRDEAHDLQHILDLVHDELSEPYNIYTFRFFLDDWPHLSFFAYPHTASTTSDPRPPPIGCIVCKQELHKHTIQRGYIGMLSVNKEWRRKGIAKRLILLAVEALKANGADEIILETEFDNVPSLALYASLGFIRQKRLYRFYLNGKDAFRLVLPMKAEDRTNCEERRRIQGPGTPRPMTTTDDQRFFI